MYEHALSIERLSRRLKNRSKGKKKRRLAVAGMAVRKSRDGWVLFVFRRTKMCLGVAQALPGGSGGMLRRENFGKIEPNPAILCVLGVKTE